MSFYLFLLVVVSLTCGSAPAWAEPSAVSLVASLGVVAGWSLLCHIASRLMARQFLTDRLSLYQAGRLLEIQLEAFRWLALPVVVLCLAGFSLAAWVRELPVFEDSLLLQSLVLLAPGMLILMATWSAEYRFAVAVGLTQGSLRGLGERIGRSLRAGPAWLLGPTLLFLTLGDLLGYLQATQAGWPSWLGDEATRSWLTMTLSGVVFITVVVMLPRFVTWMIRQEPMDSAQREEIHSWLNRCGISTHPRFGTRVIRWDTDGRTINAMVAGFVPWGRVLLLSDRVLDELPRNQRLMVVMHEVAHARRWHIVLRMLAILPAWFLSAAVSDWLVDEAWGPLVGGVTGLVTTVIALGLVSYATELDADAAACRLAVRAISGDGARDAVGDQRWAADSMGDALVRVTADHPASRRASWLHPSLAMRLWWLARRPLPRHAAQGHTQA